ncbi:MAG: NADH-quinone oxidoreductase subunit L [Phycisphaerae bacterium]
MTSANLMQACLIIGVLTPLASFVFLVFAGTRLGGRGARSDHHDQHSHDHADAHAGDAHDPRHAAPAAGEPLAGWFATAAIGVSFLCAIITLIQWAGLNADARALASRAAADAAWHWLTLGQTPIRLGVNLDSLTIIVFLMVTLTATCIHVFSVGYMRGDPRFARFFTYLSLFCFSMLGLVISANLVLLFMFWELVGICSYLLIGFWFEKRSASNAAIKAFVVNRVGDFGFMIGLGLCFAYLGTLSLHDAGAAFQAAAHASAGHEASLSGPTTLFTSHFLGVSLATWLGLGLFCGAVGKSAQFPLQVWLPDAMEGPTPVSALIHAATMVAAGVYLVARIFALLTPGAQLAIAWIGCITLTMAALIAIVQTDIKRVLAYSTLSQLGYMIFGLGVGAWVGALFHLLTHAFFKALLFLGAGQVIAGTHHEQDLRKMGGLAEKMPRTAGTFLIAVLAISGAGIPWTALGLGGFYSKEEILAVAHYRALYAGDTAAAAAHADAGAAGHDGHAAPLGPVAPISPLLYLFPVIIAYVTPFYMGRCYVLAFMGKPRDEHLHKHAHEQPLMYVPLLVLAAMTLVSGWFLFRKYVADAAPAGVSAVVLDGHMGAVHAGASTLALLTGFAWVVGLGGAWWLYRDGLAASQRLAESPALRPIHRVLMNKFYFDHAYNLVLVAGTRGLSVLARIFDGWVVDRIGDTLAFITERVARFSGVVLDNLGVDGLVNGVGAFLSAIGAFLRRLQTGVVRNYVTFAVGALACTIVALWSPRAAAALLAVIAVALAWPRDEDAPAMSQSRESDPSRDRRGARGAAYEPSARGAMRTAPELAASAGVPGKGSQ